MANGSLLGPTLGPAFEAAKSALSEPDYLGMTKQIAKGASQAMQTQQQPAYQSMVPPQSMTIQPPPPEPGRPARQAPHVTAQNLMQHAAQQKLGATKEESGNLGSGIGTLIGGIAGAFTPAGPAAGGALGGALGGLFD